MSRRGWAYFLAMAVIWGIPYLLIRVAVRELNPGVLVFLRTAPAAILLTPVVLMQRQMGVLIRNLKWIAIFGVAEFGVPWFLMATAEEHITSSLTSLLICCVPLFSVVGQRIRRTEGEIAPRRYVGLGIGAVGVALLVGLDLRGGAIGWIVLMLVVCVGYTIGPVLLATKLKEVPGPTVVMGATAFVSLCWIPWDLTHLPLRVSSETWSCVAILSLVCTAGAFLVFFELVKEVGSTRSTVVTYINTAIAVVLGIVGLHEPLTVGIAAGFPFVLVGSVIATSRAGTTAKLTPQSVLKP
ncbi:MAG: DMT family transporter [Acidimicrobiales bacterium]